MNHMTCKGFYSPSNGNNVNVLLPDLACICYTNCASSRCPKRFASTRTAPAVEFPLSTKETMADAKRRNAVPTIRNKLQLLLSNVLKITFHNYFISSI